MAEVPKICSFALEKAKFSDFFVAEVTNRVTEVTRGHQVLQIFASHEILDLSTKDDTLMYRKKADACSLH